MLSTDWKGWWPSCTYWRWYNNWKLESEAWGRNPLNFEPRCVLAVSEPVLWIQTDISCSAVAVVADKLFTISRWSEAQSHNTCQWQWKIFRKQCFPTSTYYHENQFLWTWRWWGHHSEKELYSRDKYSVVRVMFWWCNQSFLWPLNENLRRQVTVT